jgi:hypothetical protein
MWRHDQWSLARSTSVQWCESKAIGINNQRRPLAGQQVGEHRRCTVRLANTRPEGDGMHILFHGGNGDTCGAAVNLAGIYLW